MIKKYENLITDAINNVSSNYYHISTTYKREGIIRERVFCYELYHQIRLIQEDKEELSLFFDAEIDKRGHCEFESMDRRNPDFIFHARGDMSQNTIIMEVKGALSNGYKRKILKDFDTLIIFIEKYNYEAGYFLLFNHSYSDFFKKMGKGLAETYRKKYTKGNNDNFTRTIRNIKILCKKDYGSELECKTLMDVFKNILDQPDHRETSGS